MTVQTFAEHSAANANKSSVKQALASVDEINSKAKEAVTTKRDASKKGRAYDIITTMREAGQNETAILKTLQEELGISYPNAYYYTKRVFAK